MRRQLVLAFLFMIVKMTVANDGGFVHLEHPTSVLRTGMLQVLS